MIKTFKEKLLETLNMTSSIVLILILIPVLSGASIHFKEIMTQVDDFNQQMFFIALFIAIVTVIGQWIEGRIKVISKLMNFKFKENNKEVKHE